MKHLVTVAALGLCTSVFAQSVITDGTSSRIISRDGSTVSAGTITSRDGSTVSGGTITSRDGSTVSSGSNVRSRGGSTVSSTTSSNGSVILDNQSSVTTSTTIDGTGSTTRSIIGRTGSMCSAGNEGQRCEISCQLPQVAQCANPVAAGEPACFCK